jgi:hypothetical protein
MIYREGTIPKTPGQLRDQIGVAILSVPKRKFPCSVIDGNPYWDFEGIFYSIQKGAENLRKRFGDAKANQLLEMLAQAKVYYETGENRLGGPLLQDTQMVLMDRQPWAYPKELYRWEVDSSLPEISEADLLNKGDQDE